MPGINIPFHSFTGHLGEILDVLITSDSKYIIYAVNDGTIRILDFESKKLIRVIQFINSFPISVILSFDEKYIAAADSLGFIDLWNFDTGQKLDRIRGFDKELFDIVFSNKDYYLIASGESEDFIIVRWKIDKKGKLKLDKKLEVDDEITKLIVTPKNKSIAALGEDIIYVSNFNLDKGLQQIEHEGLCTMNISSDGKQVFGGDIHGKIQIWDLKKGKHIDELHDLKDKKEFGKPIYNLAISSDNKNLIYGDRLKIKIWNLENKTILREIKASGRKDDKDKFNTVEFSPDNNIFIAGCSQRLRIGSIETDKWLKAIRRPPISPPYFDDYSKAEISPDLKYLIGIRLKIKKDKITEIIEVWQIKDMKRLFEIEPPLKEGAMISCLAIAPNGKFFVTGDDTDSADARAIIWNMKTGKIKKQMTDLDYGVNALIISHDSNYIITSDQTFDIEVWDAKTGKLRKKLSESTKNISHFALTDDHKYLVCAFRDVLDREHDIIIWDLELGKIVNQLSANIDWNDKIVWIGFSNDQKYLYARSEHGYLINWEIKSHKFMKKIEDHDNYVLFNPFRDVNLYPLAENVILSVSDDIKEVPSHFKEFIQNKLQNSDWITNGLDHYYLKDYCTEDQINGFILKLESLL